ncbi:MAG: cation acetate symporter, partial [Gammaproteobacteria bacterium]|nr:cation acetate symporter [Gammaproteobacteria bacterium]
MRARGAVIAILAVGGGGEPAAAADAVAGEMQRQALNPTAITLFLLFIAVNVGITWWAARRSRTRHEFYAAGGGIPAWQNGIAIAGDFTSAATLLGITSAIYFNGLDAVTLLIGPVLCFPLMVFLIAERLRNLGRFTFIDVISYRLSARRVRVWAALASLVVVLFYLIGQVVGAGKLVQLLFGLDYQIAVIFVSVLMMFYVLVGGMLATTWVQFLKAVLLTSGTILLALLMLAQFDFNVGAMLQQATANHPDGAGLLAPGGWVPGPISVFSVGVTMLFGFLGLPHVLMRLFTVRDARAARESACYALGIIGTVNTLVIFLGIGAVALVMNNPDYHDASGALYGGRNMVVLHLADMVGGSLLLGFISAVTFATILAVVAGLTLAGAATVAHDLYGSVIAEGKGDDATEILISRITVVVIGVLSVLLGLAFEKQNIVFVVTMALVVAASVNTPVLLASMYWGGLTTRGVVAGIITGLTLSVGLILVGPQVMGAVFGAKPLFPYFYPTLFSMPPAIVALWLFSVTDKSARADAERAAFARQEFRSETGIGAGAAA